MDPQALRALVEALFAAAIKRAEKRPFVKAALVMAQDFILSQLKPIAAEVGADEK